VRTISINSSIEEYELPKDNNYIIYIQYSSDEIYYVVSSANKIYKNDDLHFKVWAVFFMLHVWYTLYYYCTSDIARIARYEIGLSRKITVFKHYIFFSAQTEYSNPSNDNNKKKIL